MSDATSTPVDFDLTCWYLNQRRVMELLDPEAIAVQLQPWRHFPADHGMRKTAELVVLKDALQAALRQTPLPTFGQLLKDGPPTSNALFTYYTNFFFRGVRELARIGKIGKTSSKPAFAYAKLDDFLPEWTLELHFHVDHFTSCSSFTELSGQKAVFVLALVTEIAVADKVVRAIPYVIAYPLPGLGQKATLIGERWRTKSEIYPEELDCFSRIADQHLPDKAAALTALRKIPEADVKTAFAEIIGESTVTKDWGGESCDLISHLVTVDGTRMPTAFLLKGPARFSPMKAVHLGKNGDQIVRLFSEEAELFILQHCHDVTSAVRAQMRAFSQQISRLKLFCIVDGYSTYRILLAYGKCGISV